MIPLDLTRMGSGICNEYFELHVIFKEGHGFRTACIKPESHETMTL